MSVKNFWKMTKGKVLEGVLGINKPIGISSAGVVRDLQRHFSPSATFKPWISIEKAKRAQQSPNQRNRRKQKEVLVKIGHGGTLDPMASGVLIVGVGSGTKVLQKFLSCVKTYDAVVLFGVSTDSYDSVGKILKRASHKHITKEMVEKALDQFRGEIMQMPPLYSALKMNGKPLYEYAREGKEIPRRIEKRPVEVKELEMVEWMEGGTHNYKWPTEEAEIIAKAVAEKVWQQAKEPDTNIEDVAEGNLAAKKRKLEESQDDLVSERPSSKRKNSTAGDNITMSGGLQPPDMEQLAEASKTEDNGPPAARIRMTVTSGFYVRSLCHDLGEAVSSQAIMAELNRTQQGQFKLGGKNVLEYSDLDKGEVVWGKKVEAMLNDWEANETPVSSSKSGARAEPEEEGGLEEAEAVEVETVKEAG